MLASAKVWEFCRIASAAPSAAITISNGINHSARPTAATLAVCAARAGVALAEETIKVGVLHSLSGTMAISETTLKDTVLMMVEEQNKKGGLLLLGLNEIDKLMHCLLRL